jgi:hypothetical protein
MTEDMFTTLCSDFDIIDECLFHMPSGLEVCRYGAAAIFKDTAEVIYNDCGMQERWKSLTPKELWELVEKRTEKWFTDGMVFAEYYLRFPPRSFTEEMELISRLEESEVEL